MKNDDMYDDEGFPKGERRDAFTDAFISAMRHRDNPEEIKIQEDYTEEFKSWVPSGRWMKCEVDGIQITFSAEWEMGREKYRASMTVTYPYIMSAAAKSGIHPNSIFTEIRIRFYKEIGHKIR